MRRVLHLCGREADFLGEVIAPGFEQFAVAVKNGDARVGGAGRDIDAVFRINNNAATETVIHPFGQFAPVFVERVSVLAAADADGRFLFGSVAQTRHDQARGRDAGHF